MIVKGNNIKTIFLNLVSYLGAFPLAAVLHSLSSVDYDSVHEDKADGQR